ncbi:hypothetical protein F3Y22_tig00111101pilonHSYRG00065 [Hibiscus syriacus]|uniref:Uncharacterized protein n=1 Tax=Hibiscus syriacus TaxID=106335 RepID=A0A6A2Z0T4_HIBSY|nr:hypothetical protein F3Y22_tig00111101pilonHSYRG00065 [Hibiscus syriacus]
MSAIAKSVDHSLWWEPFSSLLTNLENTSPSDDLPKTLAKKLKENQYWFMEMVSRFKLPNEKSKEALATSQQIKIGPHELTIKLDFRDKVLQVSSYLCLDEVQSYILVNRYLERGNTMENYIVHDPIHVRMSSTLTVLEIENQNLYFFWVNTINISFNLGRAPNPLNLCYIPSRSGRAGDWKRINTASNVLKKTSWSCTGTPESVCPSPCLARAGIATIFYRATVLVQVQKADPNACFLKEGSLIREEALKMISNGLEGKLISVVEVLMSCNHPERWYV